MREERRKQSPHSIRAEMMKVTTVSILAMFFLFLLLIAVEYFALSDMRNMIGKSGTYTAYYNSCEQIHQSMLDYMSNQREESKEKCEKALEVFSNLSSQLKEAFDHPRFEDNYYLSAAYQEKVRQFLQTEGENVFEEQMKLYTQAEQIRGYLQYNSRTLHTIHSELISEGSQKIFVRWMIQLLCFLGAAVFCSIFIWYRGSRMVKKILFPILELTEQAKKIQEGNLEMEMVSEDLIENQETFVLTKTFAEMIKTIQKQMEELKENIALTKKLHALELQNMQFQFQLTQTKMQLMQSMINPHFLFNCLNTLSSLAYLEHAKKTRDASGMIAGYLRNSLSFVGKKISLEEEMDHTRRYMEIQKLRFGERIQFLAECSPDCAGVIVPGMILQPLAENAISHGLKAIAQNGYVKIEAKKEEDIVRITVTDNGKGMTRERLKAVREVIEQDASCNSERQGIGLCSVVLRMKMVFGAAFAVRLESQAGRGTQIEMQIRSTEQE